MQPSKPDFHPMRLYTEDMYILKLMIKKKFTQSLCMSRI